jgi:glutamate-ammonia-ligase adenylyltransferase
VLGRAFLKLSGSVIYDRPFDDACLEDVRAMKRRIDHQMAVRDQRTRNVKLGAGGIREIELITQSLQARHGAQLPSIRQRNTMAALAALRDHGLISAEECETLCLAYTFLRDVENKLQMVNDAQTHSLPLERRELTACARLLGYYNPQGDAAEPFLRDYQRHTQAVNRIFESRILSGHL